MCAPENVETELDVKPLKTNPEGRIPLNVFGDTYTELLDTVKEELSSTLDPDKTSSLLQILEVKLLGMYLKSETVTCDYTTCTIDPDCILHGVHIHVSHSLQDSLTTLPEKTGSTSVKSPEESLRDETLQEATEQSTDNLSLITLPEATNRSST